MGAATKSTPQGAYTTFRTYNHNQVFHISSHFQRLEETAKLARVGKEISVDQELLRFCLRKVINEIPGHDLRLRITLDLYTNPGDIYIARENLSTPAQSDYQAGVRVITRNMARSNPKAKLTNFIHQSESIKSALPPDTNEAIMVDGNEILLEGLSSNFFAVLEGKLWTEENNVLSGITRSIVLKEARDQGIPIIFAGIHRDDLLRVSEAFITSTSRSVLPVTKIDEVQIGDGKPGPISKLLYGLFENHIQRELENI
jgi:branched-chain amino acid aminotransferase